MPTGRASPRSSYGAIQWSRDQDLVQLPQQRVEALTERDLLKTLTQEAMAGTLTFSKSLSQTVKKAISLIDGQISKQLAEIMANLAPGESLADYAMHVDYRLGCGPEGAFPQVPAGGNKTECDPNYATNGGSEKVFIGTMAMALLFVVGIFFAGPILIANLLEAFDVHRFWIVLVEGVVRLVLFVGYIWLIGLVPDIKRVFQYHGAEHMTIHAYEAQKPLTVAAVRPYPKEHTRCGTSFLLVVVFVALITFFPPVMSMIARFDVPSRLGACSETIRWIAFGSDGWHSVCWNAAGRSRSSACSRNTRMLPMVRVPQMTLASLCSFSTSSCTEPTFLPA